MMKVYAIDEHERSLVILIARRRGWAYIAVRARVDKSHGSLSIPIMVNAACTSDYTTASAYCLYSLSEHVWWRVTVSFVNHAWTDVVTVITIQDSSHLRPPRDWRCQRIAGNNK
jgi:hypothetical protein